jgi:electron transport complex protein RnfB
MGDTDINRCPPGGTAGIAKLAALLGREPIPLNPHNGVEKPRTLARIIEADCIGCTKCIQVCPVDAIVGANKLMHTVIADDCTGCERCIPACPVDCIVLEPMPLSQASDQAHMDVARLHFQRREVRLAEQQAAREAELAARKADVHNPETKQSVLDALARAKARKQEPKA